MRSLFENQENISTKYGYTGVSTLPQAEISRLIYYANVSESQCLEVSRFLITNRVVREDVCSVRVCRRPDLPFATFARPPERFVKMSSPSPLVSVIVASPTSVAVSVDFAVRAASPPTSYGDQAASIDTIVEICGCTREQAKHALDAAGPDGVEVAVDLILSSMSAPWASAADSRPAARETAVPLKLVCLVRRDLGMGVVRAVRSHTRTTLQAHITANAQLRMRGVYYCFDRCDSLSATCARAKLPLR